MDIRLSRETVAYWQKKGALGIRFSEKERDGVVTENAGRATLTLAVGKSGEMTLRKLILLVRRIVRAAAAQKFSTVVIDFEMLRFEQAVLPDDELAELLAVNALMADFLFSEFLTEPKDGFPKLKTLVLVNASGKAIRDGVERGKIIGEEVNRTRQIANMPGGEMTPELLAEHARQAAKGLPIKVTVLDEDEMKRLKMGGILGVGRGSDAPPRFIVMEYSGGAKEEKPIVLIGKGVTFDTGGINLKPEAAMGGMHLDMSGGAAVIHTIVAAARLGLQKNIVTLVPAAENMPSGSSYRPGDVLRSMMGKTIQVDNTDAEGRIILADALHFAKRYQPALVVDAATLTGAAVVALGERASGLFTKDDALAERFARLGEESGDHVWRLPLWDEYDEEIKGTFGDVSNLGKTRWGGAITAAVFLKQFVDGAYPWVHLDIAPRMTAIDGEHLAKGAAGAPVRLLVRLLSEAGSEK